MGILRTQAKKALRVLTPDSIVKTLGKRKHLRGQNLSYTRFVVISYQRSGSTMLVSTLKQHSNVHCYSEVFNPAYPMLFTEGVNHKSWWLKEYRRRDPVGFLEEFIYGPYAVSVSALGFKIFPEHVQNARFRPALDRIISDPTIVLFHLRRRNKLAAFLSLKRAESTGAWSSVQDHSSPLETLDLPPEKCVEFFEMREVQEKWVKSMLRNRQNCYELVFEEVINDLPRSLEQLQVLLGVEPEPISPPTKRQNPEPLESKISNFAELQDRFSGTQWESYLLPDNQA